MSRAAEKKAFIDELFVAHPEYAEALALFRELYSSLEGKEGETGISVALSDVPRATRLLKGIPLIPPAGITVDRDKAVAFIGEVIDVMQRVGNDENGGLDRLRQGLADGSLDILGLLRAALEDDRKVILETALAVRVNPPLLEFALQTPLRTALEQVSADVDPAEAEGWREHFCPVCGSPAGMAELVGEQEERHLSCSTCFYQWSFNRPDCTFCGNKDSEKLTHFFADDGPHRVDVCLVCGRYMKTRISPDGRSGVSPEMDDLSTVLLDLLATQEGYRSCK